MEAYLVDWASLLLRWLHVISAVAWIGSSFYFVMLDNSLVPPTDDDLKAKGVDGELWAVHGGGFYNPQKYFVAPKRMPSGTLHWFYWESYATWLSGVALFTVLYLYNARTFLIDASVFAWEPPVAIVAALAFLVVGWLLYDAICRVFGRTGEGSSGGDARLLALIFVSVVAASWLACRLFAGRAAFLLVGAMLGTIMSANVFFWIIPGQRRVVADLRAGRQPDPVHGRRGKQRSVHNTYFTLPVLIAMLSNHYGMLYQHPQNWLVLIALMLVGVLVRQFFVLRHRGKSQWALVLASTGLVAALVVLLAPARSDPSAAAAEAAPSSRGGFAPVQKIVNERCVMCHNAQLANKNVELHTPELIVKNAQAVYQQVVVAKTMPLNDATQITEAERAALGRWILEGAKIE